MIPGLEETPSPLGPDPLCWNKLAIPFPSAWARAQEGLLGVSHTCPPPASPGPGQENDRPLLTQVVTSA